MEITKMDKFGYAVVAILSVGMAVYNPKNWLVVIGMGIWAEIYLVVWNTLISKLKGDKRFFALLLLYLIFTIGILILGEFKR